MMGEGGHRSKIEGGELGITHWWSKTLNVCGSKSKGRVMNLAIGVRQGQDDGEIIRKIFDDTHNCEWQMLEHKS